MEQFKYYLTFDFQIIYVPDSYNILGFKKFNFETLKFENYKCNPDLVKYSYNIEENRVQYIVNGILLGKISYTLDDKSTAWIQSFESKFKDNADLLKNINYSFNYLTLKLMLAGFSKKESLNISNQYFTYKKNGYPIPTIENVINRLNELISNKEYWIINNIEKYEKIEISFIDKVLYSLVKNISDFDLKSFDLEYLEICQSSFSYENFKFNNTKSYFVNNILTFEEQKSYILYYYDFIMKNLIEAVINANYKRFVEAERMKNTVLSHLKSLLIMSIDNWK